MEQGHRLAKQGVEKLCKPIGHHAAGITLVDTTDQGEWEFPQARPTAPGRKGYRRGSALRIQNLGSNPREISMARAEYESDKYARSAVESVKSRLTWWRKRAREHGVEAYPITVESLQLLSTLLKRAGYMSAGAYLSAVKNQHIRLGHPWTNALDLELKEGKRARERGTGPLQKTWSIRHAEIGKLDDLRRPIVHSWTYVATRRHMVWLLVGNARDRVVCRQVYAGYVLGWSRLWTLRFRFACVQDGPASGGQEEDSHVCVINRCCGK